MASASWSDTTGPSGALSRIRSMFWPAYSPPDATRNSAATSPPASSGRPPAQARVEPPAGRQPAGSPALQLGQPVPGEHRDRHHAEPDEPPPVVPPRPGQRVHPSRVGAGGEHEQRAEQQRRWPAPSAAGRARRSGSARAAPPRTAPTPAVPWTGAASCISPVVRQADQLEQRPPARTGRPASRPARRPRWPASPAAAAAPAAAAPSPAAAITISGSRPSSRRARDPPLAPARAARTAPRRTADRRVQADQPDQATANSRPVRSRARRPGRRPAGPAAAPRPAASAPRRWRTAAAGPRQSMS